jgi:proliferating cell nuclear antigen PCNA
MRIKLENPVLLSRIIDIISELVIEVRIKISEEGLNITAIDPANVSMIRFVIPRSGFSLFEVNNEEILGVNLENLKRILKRCGNGSSLILETRENFLEIQIQDRIKRNFTLNLIEIEREDKEFPNLEFSSKVELNSVDFIASIEDCAVVADSCSFIIENSRFIIKARGLNSALSEFTSDEASINAENCKSKYSLEYLQKFNKGAKLFEKTILKFAEDHPLRMNFKSSEVELSFLLAPRTENEE